MQEIFAFTLDKDTERKKNVLEHQLGRTTTVNAGWVMIFPKSKSLHIMSGRFC